MDFHQTNHLRTSIYIYILYKGFFCICIEELIFSMKKETYDLYISMTR